MTSSETAEVERRQRMEAAQPIPTGRSLRKITRFRCSGGPAAAASVIAADSADSALTVVFASAHDLTALDEKYSRTDTADWAEGDYAGEAVIVITPARWIAWSYWD